MCNASLCFCSTTVSLQPQETLLVKKRKKKNGGPQNWHSQLSTGTKSEADQTGIRNTCVMLLLYIHISEV